MKDPVLVCFDTDRIQDYVFATQKLREMRGASALLTSLNTQDRVEQTIAATVSSCETVFFAGGAGALLVDGREEAENAVAAVEALYLKETYSASITGVHLALAPASRERGFGTRMEVAGLALRAAKDHRCRRTQAMIEPHTLPCASCEAYPASEFSALDGQRICASCAAKRDAFRCDRQRVPARPEDMDSLGALSYPPGYLGFIYADGNNIGDWMRQLETLERYRRFATDLDTLVTGMVNYALRHHPPRGRERILPYERLLVGGDDLMVVTTADIALPVALRIAERFEEGSRDVMKAGGITDPRPLTLGLGVVLAHAHFPMVGLHRLGRELLQSAKRRSAEGRYTTSAIDFMVVNAAGSSDLDRHRREALTERAFLFPDAAHQVRLTRRPYAVEELARLLEHAREIRTTGFPRSQLQFLYEGLFQSRREAIHRWRRVAGRTEAGHREAMERFWKGFRSQRDQTPPPWSEEESPILDSDYNTPLADLVEVYPFVGAVRLGEPDGGD